MNLYDHFNSPFWQGYPFGITWDMVAGIHKLEIEERIRKQSSRLMLNSTGKNTRETLLRFIIVCNPLYTCATFESHTRLLYFVNFIWLGFYFTICQSALQLYHPIANSVNSGENIWSFEVWGHESHFVCISMYTAALMSEGSGIVNRVSD